MIHTLTYDSIQNVQLRHNHVGRGISPYASAPARAHAHAHTNATAPHPPQMVNATGHEALTCLASVCMMCHTHAPAPVALCSGLQPCHPLMLI
ncbi:hypothetical protein O181_091840 [Austropuccinia psidii MF-1]|uniref:Uncharacterized protein n=1 Tax=Austropuccinia psidii MF-1 TaxID=1389203 RepID=A0A9Q3P8I3_9BASI|nr:hypothetical protein [Austropuccinia psidii MF-1]